MKKRYLVPFSLESEQGEKVHNAFANLGIKELSVEIAMLALRINTDPEDNSDVFADLTEYLYIAIEDQEKRKQGISMDDPTTPELWDDALNNLCEEVFDLIYNFGVDIQERYIQIGKRIQNDGFSMVNDYAGAEWLGDDTAVLYFVTNEEINKSANRLARGEF